MCFRIKIDENGRITALSKDFPLGDGEFEYTFPPDFSIEHVCDYRITDNTLVYDPISCQIQTELSNVEKLKTRADAVESAMDWAITTILGGM